MWKIFVSDLILFRSGAKSPLAMSGHAPLKYKGRRSSERRISDYVFLSFSLCCYQLLDRIDLSVDTDPDYPSLTVKSATEFILQSWGLKAPVKQWTRPIKQNRNAFYWGVKMFINCVAPVRSIDAILNAFSERGIPRGFEGVQLGHSRYLMWHSGARYTPEFNRELCGTEETDAVSRLPPLWRAAIG